MAVLAWLAIAAVGFAPSAHARDLDLMPIAGGTSRLLRAGGVSVPVEPARALVVLIPAVYGDSRPVSRQRAAPVPRFARLLAEADGAAADLMPTLLPAAVWASAIFRRQVPVERLAGAILDDRRAALLYLGLHSLDDDTLEWLSRAPALLTAIYRHHAPVFAAFAESITVSAGRVTVPGGRRAEPLWEALADAPCSAPERFVAALLGRDGGRLAWFYDTLFHVEPPRQAFALGFALERAEEARLAHVARLYNTFERFQRGAWAIAAQPFTRAVADPAFALQQVDVTPDGRMADPRSRGFWVAVLGAGVSRTEGSDFGDEVDAAWLLARLAEGATPVRRARLNSVLYAQRVARRRGTSSEPIEPPSVSAPPTPPRLTVPVSAREPGSRLGWPAGAGEAFAACLAAFPAHQMLAVTLERIGLDDPAACRRATALADSLVAPSDRRGSTMRIAMLQGALALLARVADRGALERGSCRRLASELVGVPDDPPTFVAALARWLDHGLVAALPQPAGPSGAGSREARLLDALAGVDARRVAPVVDWEGRRYRLDPASAERRRLERVVARLDGVRLDEALDAARLTSVVAAPGSSRTEVDAARARIRELLPVLAPPGALFGFPLADLVDDASAAVEALPPGDRPAVPAGPDRRLTALVSVALAEALASMAYAVAIGDPEAVFILAENPARRHDFAVGSPLDWGGPWNAPVSVRATSGAAVLGSLLGLEATFGASWLHTADEGLPPRAPSVDQADVRGFGESVALLNAIRLTDAGRDWIAASLARGRARIAGAGSDAAAVDVLLSAVGVERWRRRLARDAASRGPEGVGAYLSLVEVLAVGTAGEPPEGLDAFGLSQRAIDGSLRLRLPATLGWRQRSGRPGSGLLASSLPDAWLRIVDLLAEARLPAALLPGLVARAACGLRWSAEMAGPDDWLPLARVAQALTRARLDDDVAALTCDGPLVPIGTSGDSGG